ncbi:proline-rich domain-containing protein [Natribaculum luteum]|uniref:Proline-rich domain-containing protein n=1 Tax=Natribaculum luteum TaxID=1586232 RepID=A0ABD5P3A0_9EURY|nr:proline-rich domain-containing protein [Natribaculum luteum]
MTTTRAVVLATLVAVCGLTIAPLASAAVVGGIFTANDVSDTDGGSQPMGAEVSTFMQSSAADTTESVDAGMFEAEYRNAGEKRRADAVADRTNRLEQKLESLKAEREALRENGDEHSARYEARMASLAVRIGNLERAINDTVVKAQETGVETAKLERLRTDAANLSGPEIAAVASGLAGVEPPRGPPEGTPAQGSGPQSPDQGPPERGDEQQSPDQTQGPSERGGGPQNDGDDTGDTDDTDDTSTQPDPAPDDKQ